MNRVGRPNRYSSERSCQLSQVPINLVTLDINYILVLLSSL